MMETLEYSDAKEEYLGVLVDGKLRIHDKGIIFRNARTGKSLSINSAEIESAQWIRLGAAYGIRLLLKNGNFHRFGGLKESENEKVKEYFKEKFDTDLVNLDYSTRGWNWGEAEFTGSVLPFKVRDKPAFDIPLTYVSSSVFNKNEVTIGFHQNDDAPISLTEVRFHIPTKEAGDDNEIRKFNDYILDKANVLQETGDAIVAFNEVFCTQPSRGRYDFKFYPTFLHLHGKTYDFKIPYSTVIRIFMLPDPKQRIYYLVVSLDPPVKHGQTRYHFLIMSFDRDEETNVELQISEEDIQNKYDGKLEKEMSGTECVIFAKLLKVLSGRKVISSDSSAFKSHQKAEAVSCNFKAQSGLMYPLDRGFMYVGKPPAHIRFDEIAYVNFARSNTATKSFDLDIETKNGQVYSFSSIPKEEYAAMYDFMKSKHVRIKNRGITGDSAAAGVDAGSDVASEGSEGDDDYDPYLQRMKKEGKQREDGDITDSDDDDYDPDNIEMSDVADEYDSNVSSTTTDSEDATDSSDDSTTRENKRQRKQDKKAEKASRKAKVRTVREPGQRRKKKKQKGEKDPNAPKRPQTAYFMFLNDKREQIKADNPDIAVTEVAKKAAEMWKEVDADVKAKYEEKVAEAKKKYEVALAEYRESGGGGGGGEPSSKRKKGSSGTNVSPSKAGSGAGYKSKEFLEEDDSSDHSDSEEDEKPLKELKKGKSKQAKKSEDEASGSGGGDDAGSGGDAESSDAEPEANDDDASD